MKRAAYIFPLILCLSVTCFAQNGVATKVDDYIRAVMMLVEEGKLSLDDKITEARKS